MPRLVNTRRFYHLHHVIHVYEPGVKRKACEADRNAGEMEGTDQAIWVRVCESMSLRHLNRNTIAVFALEKGHMRKCSTIFPSCIVINYPVLVSPRGTKPE